MACSKIGLPLPPGNWQGRVHSVFEHSFNIDLGENRPFLVIHSFRDIVPPGSFYTEDLDTGPIKAGMEVFGDGKMIRIGEIHIPVAEGCLYLDTALPELENRRFHLKQYQKLIDEKRREQQVPSDMALEIHNRLIKGAESFFEALKGKHPQKLKEAAGLLIGLGPGLTPSGDDLLSGILAVLKCFDPAGFQLASQAVLTGIHKTNDISKSYLLWACGGYGSDAVIHTIQGFTNEEENRAALKLLQLGHTSGADILEGLVLAAGYLRGDRQVIDRNSSNRS